MGGSLGAVVFGTYGGGVVKGGAVVGGGRVVGGFGGAATILMLMHSIANITQIIVNLLFIFNHLAKVIYPICFYSVNSLTYSGSPVFSTTL